MAERNSLMGADTSTYRPYQGGNMLEQMAGITGIANSQQDLQMKQLETATKQLGMMRSTLSSLLANENVSAKDVIEAGGKLAAEGIITPQMLATELSGMPQDSAQLRQWLGNHLTNTMDTEQKIRQVYGVNDTVETGGRIVPGVRAPASRGGGFTAAPGQPAGIAREQDPNTLGTPTRWTGVNGEDMHGTLADYQQYVRQHKGKAVPPPVPEDTPGGVPAASASPAEPGIAPNPQYGAGREAYTKDLQTAGNLAEANRPLLKSIPILEKLPMTGKGTGSLNDLKTIATNLGIDPAKWGDEQTAYGELNKYLEQYSSRIPGAGRSDAALYTSKESNPNLSTTTAATLALAKNAVAWNRMDAAKAKAFEGQAGANKFGDYPTHAANWVQNQDSRAYGIDLMPAEKRQALLDQMKADAGSDDAGKKKAAIRFWRSLQTAQQTGVMQGVGE